MASEPVFKRTYDPFHDRYLVIKTWHEHGMVQSMWWYEPIEVVSGHQAYLRNQQERLALEMQRNRMNIEQAQCEFDRQVQLAREEAERERIAAQQDILMQQSLGNFMYQRTIQEFQNKSPDPPATQKLTLAPAFTLKGPSQGMARGYWEGPVRPHPRNAKPL